MSTSNYQPNVSLGFGGLINSGGTSQIPAAGSDDSRLLNQQQSFAAQCAGFVGSVSVIRNGIDVTNQVQIYLLNLQNLSVLTLAQAQSYFPAVSPVFWSNSVIDYKAGLAAMQAAMKNIS